MKLSTNRLLTRVTSFVPPLAAVLEHSEHFGASLWLRVSGAWPTPISLLRRDTSSVYFPRPEETRPKNGQFPNLPSLTLHWPVCWHARLTMRQGPLFWRLSGV